MIGMPNTIEKYVPLARKDRKVAKALTGLSIALVEAFILCPVERLKVYLMTNNVRGGSLFAKLKADSASGSLIRELYRGYLPLFTRQSVAWITFLTADQMMK
jgi:hypothetical protein